MRARSRASSRAPGRATCCSCTCRATAWCPRAAEWFFATPKTKVGRLGSTAVSDTYIRERMKGSRSTAIVLVLDCCHSGAFARSLLAKGGEDIHVEHHFEGRGRVALTASTEFEWALEGERGPDRDRPLSVFTELLVEGLSSGDADLDGDGQISISELYNYVAGRMPARSPGQTPGKAGDVIGEIVIASGRRKPVLPADVRQALLSSFPEFRRAAIGPLMRLRSGAEPDAAHAIDDALARLTLDDDPEVATAARAAQEEVPAPLTIDLAHLPDIREDLLPAARAAHGPSRMGKSIQLEREGDLTGAEGAYLRSVEQGNATAQSAVERVRRKRFDLERAIAVHGPRAAKDRTAAAKLARAHQVAGVPRPAPGGARRDWAAAAREQERRGDLAAAEEGYLAAVGAGEEGADRALARVRKRRSGPRQRGGDVGAACRPRRRPRGAQAGQGVRDRRRHAGWAWLSPSSSTAMSRSLNFWILPVTVVGNSSTNTHVARHLVVRDLAPAERLHLVLGQRLAGASAGSRPHLLAVASRPAGRPPATSAIAGWRVAGTPRSRAGRCSRRRG